MHVARRVNIAIDLKYIKTEVNNLNIALPLYHESVRAYQEYVLNYKRAIFFVFAGKAGKSYHFSL